MVDLFLDRCFENDDVKDFIMEKFPGEGDCPVNKAVLKFIITWLLCLWLRQKMACGTIIRSDLTRQKQILWASSEGGGVLPALIRLQPPDEIGNPAALPEH